METINRQNLSAGWDADVIRFQPGSHEWDRVVTREELATVLATWLDLVTDTDVDIAIVERLGELVQNANEDPTDAPSWTIPLNIDRLSELVTNGRYLCSQFFVGGTRYQITVDYSDF